MSKKLNFRQSLLRKDNKMDPKTWSRIINAQRRVYEDCQRQHVDGNAFGEVTKALNALVDAARRAGCQVKYMETNKYGPGSGYWDVK